MRSTLLLAALLLAACNGNGNDTSSTTDTGSTDTGTTTDSTDTAFHNSWTGADVGTAPSREPDQVIYGNLADGTVYDNLEWAHQLMCWGTNQDENHNGAHDFHEWDQPQQTDLWVRVTPSQGLDMAAYLVQRPAGSHTLPPDVTVAGAGDCTNTYPSSPNPSQPEVVCLAAFTGYEYSVLIGVTGANGLDSGPYKLEIWQNPYTGCVHPDG